MTRKLLPLLLLALSAPAFGSYAYKATVTVPYAQVSGSANLPNFTVCGYITDTSLKPVGSGGQIQHSITRNGAVVPTDFIFTTDTSGLVLDSWEVYGWDQSAGTVWYCALVTSLSYTAPNPLYVFYGNAAISTWKGGTQGSAWDANTAYVFHLYNGSLYDYGPNANNGGTAYNSPTTVAGPLGGGLTFNGATQYVSIPTSASINITGNLTVSALTWLTGVDYYGGIVSNNAASAGYALGHWSAVAQTFCTMNSTYVQSSTTSQSIWLYASFTYASSLISCYINGASPTTTAASASTSNSNPLILGLNGTSYLYGNIAEVRGVSTNRSAGWLATEANDVTAPATFAVVSALGTCSGTCGGGSAPATVTMTPIIM